MNQKKGLRPNACPSFTKVTGRLRHNHADVAGNDRESGRLTGVILPCQYHIFNFPGQPPNLREFFRHDSGVQGRGSPQCSSFGSTLLGETVPSAAGTQLGDILTGFDNMLIELAESLLDKLTDLQRKAIAAIIYSQIVCARKAVADYNG